MAKVEEDEQHIGDGLYAHFNGFHLRLRAPRITGDHVVYLEDWVYQAMREFMRQKAPEWEK